MNKQFNIVNESVTAATIAAAICVPFFEMDATQFDSVDALVAYIIENTQDRLDTQSALVNSVGSEITSRLNIDNMGAIKDTYQALSPLARQADTLTIDKLKNSDVPLYDMAARGAATLINLFIATHVEAIINMARLYDEEKRIEYVFANEPHRAVARLCSYIKRSCGHAMRQATVA